MRKIIAFTGLAGSGKTLASKWLADNRGYQVQSFAAPIKKMVSAVWPQCEEKSASYEEFGGKTLRQAYQLLGTEWGRQLMWEDIWVQKLIDSMASDISYVIDDLRFTNEAKALKDAGAIIIEIQRKGSLKMGHASEQGIDSAYIDMVLTNDSTIQDLILELEKIC
jgi:dephospho-CoA kinase